ncbi:MAG: beta-ketoacyl synthase N-terminal-like domain-containing protein, partial [Myxococcota bacterium]
VHPCILDACHVVSTFALGGEPIDDHRVPLLIKRVWVCDGLSQGTLSDCVCHAAPRLKNDHIAEFDIRLYSRQGQLLIALDGFTTKSVPNKEALLAAGQSTHVDRRDPVTAVAEEQAEQVDERDDRDTNSTNPAGSGSTIEKAIEAYLRDKVADILKRPARKISLRRTFMELGLESGTMIGAVEGIEKELGIELYPTLFFEHQNIADLARYFVQSHRQEMTRYLERSTANAPAGESRAPTAQVSAPAAPVLPAEQAAVPAAHKGRVRMTQSHPTAAPEIAIIGMSGYLPQSETLAEFWHHIERADDLIEEIPVSHWDYRPWFDSDRSAINKTYSKWGSFLADIDKFDPVFFGISPRLADWIDPQLRLLLQSVHETLEDAGAIRRVIGSKTGVYVGCCFQEYWDEIIRARIPMVDYQAHSAAMSSLSGTVSYIFDLQGGSIPLDNACASSLTALHLACRALQSGEC